MSGPRISDAEDLSNAAGVGPKVDPKVTNRRIYYARMILALLDDGLTATKIAAQVGKHRQSIYETMKRPWFLAEQAKWHGKKEARHEVAQQISMAGALDELKIRFAGMLKECADVIEAGLKSEDERVRIDCAKFGIEKAEEAAPDATHTDTEDSLLGQVDRFLPPGDVQ